LPRSESFDPERNESVLSLAENPECRLDLAKGTVVVMTSSVASKAPLSCSMLILDTTVITASTAASLQTVGARSTQ
jgi:hypothetical protein